MSRRASNRIQHSETVHPARMSEADRKAFSKQLYPVHATVFAGVSEQDFLEHVVAPPARRTVVRVFWGAENTLAGYCAFHSFLRQIRGRPAIVIRAEAGLLEEYRGRGAAHWFGLVEAFKEKLRHPATRVYYFGTLVHPSSYRYFAKYFPSIYPHPNHDTSEESEALAVELADSFSDPIASPKDPLIRDVGWITVEPKEVRRKRQQDPRVDVRYFVRRNRGYTKGYGLVVFMPVTLLSISRAIFRRGYEMLLGRLPSRRK